MKKHKLEAKVGSLQSTEKVCDNGGNDLTSVEH